MFRVLTIIALIAAVLFGAAFAHRARWIKGKIAVLSWSASTAYAPANAALLPKGTRARIVLIGDSRVKQWPAELFSTQLEIINRGAGGETTAQTAERFQADALSLNADVIVIEIGINDLVAASFMDEAPRQNVTRHVIERIQTLAEQASAAGIRVLIATIVPPASPDIARRFVWDESLRDLVAEVNAALRKSVWPTRVRVIDLANLLVADDPKTLSPEYRKDTLHLNIAGYERLTFGFGRSGGTALMSLLAAAPRVAFDRAYPFEHRYLTYLAKLALLLERQDPRARVTPHRLYDFAETTRFVPLGCR